MTRYIRRAAVFCGLLLFALLVNATRVQVLHADAYDENPANRRDTIARYRQPRGDILVDGRPVTGSRDTREHLRYERTYADGPLYAPVTGFASQEYGTTLLEHTEDGLLAGTDPLLQPLPLWNDFTRSRNAGGDVLTTIHPAAQRAAYEGLRSRKGAVAAVEPSTGRILALVSVPSYDPELLSGNGAAARQAWARLNADPDKPMLNRAARQTYPPGSTFKVVTAAAALDAGVVTDLDEPTDSPDPYTLPGTTTRLTNESRGCADASVREAFTWSCNTVFAKVGVATGLADLTATAEGFGFNEEGLRVPFPVARSTFDTTMDRAQLALSSIGQYNTRATPLQMAMVAAAVANNGHVREPYLVERTTRASGGTVSTAGPGRSRQAMYPSTALRMRELMRGVVEEGTGTNAAIRGAVVGGKTGTAQHGIGNSGTPYAWFVSWAQNDGDAEAKVAVAVVVEDAAASRREISGGGTAAPIAKAVMEAVLKP
ncbi:penicillin-binding transpeptidase domain-containing protein [Streptomyces sp. NBC_01635]|uniref:Penicillin-binding transpeptidase domain-containing protein n=1 Tax=Streptomyces hirsutus TaxID=35620 RepID=A0ABZ1GUL5_9ACTN|nr:penicillin-binding transpeptidase domain-containing protein [Streptomyces hirsutus]WSD08901.1 penicillin-binding transpeptidase domain-containing protein [Streptomyces hirsutus]WTD77479.1 penicillin-binding transpeptidase domain-containing protein [Streptomyces sp. NBC_01635]